MNADRGNDELRALLWAMEEGSLSPEGIARIQLRLSAANNSCCDSTSNKCGCCRTCGLEWTAAVPATP